MVVDSAELAMVPSTTVPVTQETEVRRVLRLLEALDDALAFARRHGPYDLAMLIAGLYVVLNLLADILYFVVNPRLRGTA